MRASTALCTTVTTEMSLNVPRSFKGVASGFQCQELASAHAWQLRGGTIRGTWKIEHMKHDDSGRSLFPNLMQIPGLRKGPKQSGARSAAAAAGIWTPRRAGAPDGPSGPPSLALSSRERHKNEQPWKVCGLGGGEGGKKVLNSELDRRPFWRDLLTLFEGLLWSKCFGDPDCV